MVKIGTSTFRIFLRTELACKSLLRSHHFIYYMGRLPTTLDMDTNAKKEIDVDTHKGEIAIKFNEAGDLSQNNIKGHRDIRKLIMT